MFVLSGTTVHYLVPGCDYIIGRKTDSDIVVDADIKYGVSRHHGKLSYNINGELLYTDTSQFGSYVGSKKILSKQSVAVEDGSSLIFGQHPVVWKLERMKVAISDLQGPLKGQVVGTVRKLKIPFSGTWDPTCTTLIMSKISTTVKVIMAVAHCRTILTPTFIADLKDAINSKSKVSIDVLTKYVPPVNEHSLSTVKFVPNPARKTLFQDLTFVFTSSDDMKQSEEIVKSLRGTTLLLDPLQPDRRSIILSKNSIVMETKDAALSAYLRKTLSELSRVPTKHADLALALFYTDTKRLFKAITDHTQSSQIIVLDTQCMSQMTCTLQETQPLNETADKSGVGDVSMFQPSVIPPRLDKTIITPLRINRSDSVKTESCATTIKPETQSGRCPVISQVEAKSEQESDPSPDKAKPDVSFFEPSAVPPRLDKTIKTPQPSPFSTKQGVSFFEPSAVPPRLDKTLKSPASSMLSSGKSSNVSVIQPSNLPTPLDRTPAKCKAPAAVTPLATPADPATPLFATPARNSSDVSLFDNSRSTAFANQSLSTPLGSKNTSLRIRTPQISATKNSSVTNKRRLLSESDSDSDDDNPFAKSKSSKSILFTHQKNILNSSNTTTDNSKKPRIDSPNDGDSSASKQSSEKTPSAANSNVTDPDSIGRVCDSPPPDVTTSQPIKRELQEKCEPVKKKFKPSDSPALSTTSSTNITQIPDTSHSIWMVNSRAKTDIDRPFASLVITNFSVDLIKPPERTSTTTANDSVCATTVVNYKRFKKKGLVTRSVDITLCNGQFRMNATSMFDASQPQQSLDEDEEEEESIFAERHSGSRRPIGFF